MGTQCSVCWTKKDEDKILSTQKAISDRLAEQIRQNREQYAVVNRQFLLAYKKHPKHDATNQLCKKREKLKLEFIELRTRYESASGVLQSMDKVDSHQTFAESMYKSATLLKMKVGNDGSKLAMSTVQLNAANAVIGRTRQLLSESSADALDNSLEHAGETAADDAETLSTASSSTTLTADAAAAMAAAFAEAQLESDPMNEDATVVADMTSQTAAIEANRRLLSEDPSSSSSDPIDATVIYPTAAVSRKPRPAAAVSQTSARSKQLIESVL